MIDSFHEHMTEYKKQLEKGDIIKAYSGLMAYFRNLRSNFSSIYPDHYVSGIYYGYMDMTYFAISPESLKRRKLKIAIVFVHDTFRFEVWLSGSNRNIQAEYWKLIKGSGWKKYNMASNPKRDDYIIGEVLAENPDFSDLDALTQQIERGTLEFIRDVEEFLSQRVT